MLHVHREFAELVKLNAVAKLPESEFEVDPGLNEMIESQIKAEEETVRQVSWLSHSSLPCCSANNSHQLMVYSCCMGCVNVRLNVSVDNAVALDVAS